MRSDATKNADRLRRGDFLPRDSEVQQQPEQLRFGPGVVEKR